MAQDWKEMLAGLAGEVPSAPEESPREDESAAENQQKPLQTAPLHVAVDRKGRKGKVATIIEGFELDDDEVAEIASELKRKIGTGGSSRGGEILLQGDWREKVTQLLRSRNFKVK